MKKLLIILLTFISLSAFANYERVRPTYLGAGVSVYGDIREYFEFNQKEHFYDFRDTNIGSL